MNATSPIRTSTYEKPSTPSTVASEDEYETAYDKLQKMQRRLCDPDDVPTDSGAHNDESINDSADNSADANSSKKRRGYGASSSLENLSDSQEDGIDVARFALDDCENKRGSLFDDAEMNDAAPMDESDDEKENEEHGMSDDEEGYTEASARFSQGLVRQNVEAIESDADEGEAQDFKDETENDNESEDRNSEADHTEELEPEAKDDTPEFTENTEENKESEADHTETPTPPTEAQLHAQIDTIYQSADKNTMTVKQVNASIAAHFGMDKVDKGMKTLIKERLRLLVSGEISLDAAADAKQNTESKSDEEFEGEIESEEEANDASSDYEDAPRKSRRSSRKPKKGKMAQHLREHTNKIRRRHLEEARIRQEELGNIQKSQEEGPKLSEEDRERARAIAARFDTNREEEVERREEERVGLIDVLRKRRLEILSLGGEKLENQNLKEEVKEEKMIELEDDEEDSSEEEEELDVAPAIVKKTSAMDCLMAKKPLPQVSTAKPKAAANSRLALRNALRAKQIKAGNRWLANELGYKNEQDHIKECMEIESKKRKQALFLEQQAALGVKKELGADNPAFDVPADDDAAAASGDEEEDEELAMAKQLEQSEVKSEAGDMADEEMFDQDGDAVFKEENDQMDNISNEKVSSESLTTAETPILASNASEIVSSVVSLSGSRESSNAASTSYPEEELDAQDHKQTEDVDNSTESLQNEHDSTHSNNAHDAVESNNEDQDEADVSDQPEKTTNKSNKPRNSAWQEMLRKEKEMLSKQKKIQKKGGGLVEGEAEEEEEEEGIVGLEDFGFSVEKKKDEDLDDENADADEDDLEHVVDDLSDGEGDEEAGEEARKKLEAREEKERHKEIMRRMREGYDGRRGGIASGAGARGIHRFDQLVAADNREDAKRLGLLNEDEMDSDDEENENGEPKTKKDADDDDEAALLDRMLKERFLNREEEDVFEENFSDSEDEDADDQEANGNDPEDDEEKEQDRLAKQFAKRARMNRILEAYEGDTEFSRSRLIDEDASMQIELKTMKNMQAKKRGSIYSDANSNLSSGFFKRQKSDSNTGSQHAKEGAKATTSSFTSRECSLSLALLASRSTGRKRKTTFLSGKQSTSFSRQNSSSNKSISLGHVIFVTGDSQGASQLSSSASNLNKSNSKKSVPKFSASNSLWNRAISKNWSGKK